MKLSFPVSLFVGAGVGMASACNTPTVCAGLPAPTVEVTVVDSLTAAPAAAGATLLIYDLELGGARADSVTGQLDSEVLATRYERAGRFSVVVRKTGYRDWTKSEVLVRGGCPMIHTAELTARLARP